MRVWLICNAGAGDGVSSKGVMRAIEAAGHTLVGVGGPPTSAGTTFPEDIDLVVVAGGDGTVRRTAAALVGHDLPLAVLPLGTANNIAGCLGVTDGPEAAVAAWAHARRVAVDLCSAEAPIEGHYMESVGAGLVAEGIFAMDRDTVEKRAPAEMLPQARRSFRDVLAGLVARPATITLDGQSREGDYLFVEVLNTCMIGPGLSLAPDALLFDGLLDIVVARERDRPALDKYLQERLAGRGPPLALPTHRARSVTFSGWDLIHTDDELHHVPPEAPIAIKVVPAALEVLLPP